MGKHGPTRPLMSQDDHDRKNSKQNTQGAHKDPARDFRAQQNNLRAGIKKGQWKNAEGDRV